MDRGDFRTRIIAMVELTLQQHGSSENSVLLISRISKLPFDRANADRSIRRIRMAVSLLVSEDLAEDIYEELLSLLKADSREDASRYRP